MENKYYLIGTTEPFIDGPYKFKKAIQEKNWNYENLGIKCIIAKVVVDENGNEVR